MGLKLSTRVDVTVGTHERNTSWEQFLEESRISPSDAELISRVLKAGKGYSREYLTVRLANRRPRRNLVS